MALFFTLIHLTSKLTMAFVNFYLASVYTDGVSVYYYLASAYGYGVSVNCFLALE